MALRLADEEAAMDWIDANQLGRTSLTPEAMSLLRGRRYNRTKKRKQAPSGQFVRKDETAETLAEEHHVDERTIRRDGAFAAAVESLWATMPAKLAYLPVEGPSEARLRKRGSRASQNSEMGTERGQTKKWRSLE
ncbi:MAG: hypothetical protein HY674_18330 [Chloroflexi bacterium]|nr:hypothetical protein [Chloroflexota bacterium]